MSTALNTGPCTLCAIVNVSNSDDESVSIDTTEVMEKNTAAD